METILQEVKLDESNIIKQVYKELEEEFPKEETKSFEQYSKLLNSGFYKLFVLKPVDKEENIEFFGYVIVHASEDGRLMFMDYLHVLNRFQGLGLGKDILSKLKEKCDVVFYEIEPVLKNEGKEYNRYMFYKKCGAEIYNKEYRMPSQDGSISMWLMRFEGPHIERKKVQDFIRETELIIHGDFSHTSEVIDSYIEKL